MTTALYALRGLPVLGPLLLAVLLLALLLALPADLAGSGWDRVPGTRQPDTARTPLVGGRPLVRAVQRPDEPSVWERLTDGLRQAARRAAELLGWRDEDSGLALRPTRPSTR